MTIKFRIGREHLEHEDPAVRRLARLADTACRDFIAALATYEESQDLVDVDDMTTGAEPAGSTHVDGPAPVPSRTGEKAAHRRRTADIRAWARENGYPVTGTGRFPRALIEAYQAAHPQEATSE